MVRIAYRTSSGIYGPKDATFPKVSVDVEMQLKRCRLQAHSLKKCISVLLVVVAFCTCGLIVGLLSTCEDTDLEDFENNLKPALDGSQIGRTINVAETDAVKTTTKEITDTTPSALLVTTYTTGFNFELSSHETGESTISSSDSTATFTGPSEVNVEHFAREVTAQNTISTFLPVDSKMNTVKTLSNSVEEENGPFQVQNKVPVVVPVTQRTFTPSVVVESSSVEIQSNSKLSLKGNLTSDTNETRLHLEDNEKSSSGERTPADVVSSTEPSVQSEPIVKVSFVTYPNICCY